MPARALPWLCQMCWGLSPNSWLENDRRDAEHQLQQVLARAAHIFSSQRMPLIQLDSPILQIGKLRPKRTLCQDQVGSWAQGS